MIIKFRCAELGNDLYDWHYNQKNSQGLGMRTYYTSVANVSIYTYAYHRQAEHKIREIILTILVFCILE